MSFGFSVGDFLAVGNLAWDIYQSCKGMREEWFEISREVLTVHIVLKELHEDAKDPRSTLNLRGASRKEELLVLVRHVEQVLKELEIIVNRYQGLSRKTKRVWNQLRFASEDLDKIRSKLALHMNAMNAFTASLSSGKLIQIETVLLELVKEVQENRRRPSLKSIAEENDLSGWKELETELAVDGISAADVALHKEAIRVFILALLADPSTANLSLEEVASSIESSKGKDSPQGPSRAPTGSSIDKISLATLDSGKSYETALEYIPRTSQSIPTASGSSRVSFSPFIRLPDELQEGTKDSIEAHERVRQLTPPIIDGLGKRQHQHSFSEHLLGAGLMPTSLFGGGLTGPQQARKEDLILIVDPTHSCISKLAHAYLRSIAKNDRVVGELIDKVRSTAWHVHQEGGSESLSVDAMLKELLLTKKIEIPPREPFRIAYFRLEDMLQFDHIIYFNCAPFRQHLEENLENIVKLKEKPKFQNKEFARLTRLDLHPSLQSPESMAPTWPSDMFQRRQKLALEEIFQAVQRHMLDFLEGEYGLRRGSHGFEKTSSRRPKRSRSLSASPLDSKPASVSSD